MAPDTNYPCREGITCKAYLSFFLTERERFTLAIVRENCFGKNLRQSDDFCLSRAGSRLILLAAAMRPGMLMTQRSTLGGAGIVVLTSLSCHQILADSYMSLHRLRSMSISKHWNARLSAGHLPLSERPNCSWLFFHSWVKKVALLAAILQPFLYPDLWHVTLQISPSKGERIPLP